MAEKQSIKVTIFGREYTLSSQENPEQINKAAQLVDAMMKSAAEQMPNVQEEKIAVLISLQLAASLSKSEELLEGFGDKAISLTHMLDQKIDEPSI